MKKMLALLMVTILCAGILAGCGSKGGSVKLKDGESLQTIVDKIDSEIGIQMPMPLDDTLLKDLFYIDAGDVEEYYGLMAGSMTSADNVIAIKAKPDKKQVVVDGLNKRLDDVRNSFAQYLVDQSEKAKKGVVIEKGDYVFLVIIGLEMETLDADLTRAKEIIDGAF